MKDPKSFLTRWSRLKRESETAPEAVPPEGSTAASLADASAAPLPEEAGFDLSKLPSLDEIGAGTNVSLFMRSGVPSALRHAALRRAWASDPAIRDFRGPQENDWDFTAPDGVPGFGTFKSEAEIKELAHRLFGGADRELEARSQLVPQDMPAANASGSSDKTLDEDPKMPSRRDEVASGSAGATAVQQDDDAAVHHVPLRRHGGALPR